MLYYIVGEGHKDKLFEFVSLAIEHYAAKGEISQHPLPIRLEKDRLYASVLLFPGKVHAGPQADQLVLSDTGNHRLLIVDRLTGVVQVCLHVAIVLRPKLIRVFVFMTMCLCTFEHAFVCVLVFCVCVCFGRSDKLKIYLSSNMFYVDRQSLVVRRKDFVMVACRMPGFSPRKELPVLENYCL